MHTPGSEGNQRGLGAAVKDVTEHASTWFRLERELALLELKKKFAALGAGVGLFLGAAVLVVYGVGFLFATIAAGLATVMPTWLALLIVTLVLATVGGILAAVGISRIRRGTPPVPEQAIREAKLTKSALKGNDR